MTSAAPARLIEACYPPDRLQTATPGRRLSGALLDALVLILTLYVGWLIWFVIVAPRGQTPGKQMLGMYVMREDGSRAGGGYGWLREIVVKQLLFGSVISAVSLGIAYLLAALWCMWDRERQCLWDKVTSTYVAYSPAGYRPSTAADLRLLGQEPPARALLSAAAPIAPVATPAQDSSIGAGADAPPAQEGVSARLRELQRLRDEGLITAEQFEQRRAAILEEL